MRIPRPPHWLAYGAGVGLLLIAAFSVRGRADAPPPPPPLAAGVGAALAEASPIDPLLLVKARFHAGDDAGAAVSAADSGVWLTAREALADCPRPVLLINDTEGVPATVAGGVGGVAVLRTRAGAPALPLAGPHLRPGELAFAAGFVRGQPAELALRLLGPRPQRRPGRAGITVPVLAWAEVGRTQGLAGSLGGLAGAPLLDSDGRIVGLVLGERPRRGELDAIGPEALAAALVAAGAPRSPASGEVMSVDDYGLAADDLRRALRIAPIACRR